MTQFLKIKGVSHYPVMHREVSQLVREFVLEVENSKPSLQMFDGTFGGGNHTVPLLKEHRQLRALGTDLDEAVMEQCRLEYSDLIRTKRLALVHSNYANIPAVDLKEAFNRKITGKKVFDIGLLDLGMSSYQLDDEQRGFNFRNYCDDSALDMRFDTSANPNFAAASDIVNSSSQLELAQIFKRFGEERFATNLADAIILARQGTLILTTGQLKEAISKAFPQSAKTEKDAVIKRAF